MVAADETDQILNVNVGVLGHVDSGKTSLVKALSTLLSTAALDKSKESRQRGMTLDLGFSCFIVDLPDHLREAFPNKTKLQMTLVDCPGHASLIRTILGGAQIIDMVLLVVDAQKGWQAQTTECLAVAELTTAHLVVALNKADLFPEKERAARLAAAKTKVRQRLASTRFAAAPVMGVAACVGGEKVAADIDLTKVKNETIGVDELVALLQEKLPPPVRNPKGPFLFAIDHCFALRGRGTVLTGTVISGSIGVNDVVEFPVLGLERKVKSMQMFKKQVPQIVQGDRAGICVSNFDATLVERGIAAGPGAVEVWKSAICLVRKVPYFAGRLPCGSKFHISVGHTTVMATVSFWGAQELAEQLKGKNGTLSQQVTSLGAGADMAGLPRIEYDFSQSFVQQDELAEDPTQKEPLLQWALLDFQVPVHCPRHSLAIGSRLDTTDNTASGSVSACRLAFSARLTANIEPESEQHRIRTFTEKERRGVISRLGDPFKRQGDGKIVRYEVFGGDLFKKETNMKLFIGMKIETEKGDIGEIKSSFGTSGKFRVYFPAGTEAKEGEALILRFRRYAHDPDKKMHQFITLPAARSGSMVDVQKKKKKKELPSGVTRIGEVSAIKGDKLENGKHNMAIISGFFAPEVNIKDHAGTKVLVVSTKEEGSIVGPFGKAGKCKVSFESGISAEVGAKAELQL